jgi:hypothetical protein
MNTLEEAWQWYEGTLHQLEVLGRLGRKYWNDLPWEGSLGRDNSLRDLQGEALATEAAFSLGHLNDLAVVVLFSAFEALVRQRVLEEMQPEVDRLTNQTLRHAAEGVKEQVSEGSFFQLLEPFKDNDANLVEEVHQVRRYRNWVAHGRRGQQPANVGPQLAYDRLRRFLAFLSASGGSSMGQEPAG